MCKSHAVYGLTSVSAVYSADSSVQQIAAPLLSFLVYYQTDADLLGGRDLILEQKPKKHNLDLRCHSCSIYRD